MERKVLSVSNVNAYIKRVFEQDYVLKNLLVQGEISNYKKHSSGHLYFTLKDGSSAIACVMFRSYVASLAMTPANGMKVVVKGSVSVYERSGQYQIYVTAMREEGIGILYQKFEELKKKLGEEGLFDQDRKKPLPVYPRKVGIVTSDTGAAIRDIVNVAKRRNPYIQLILYPSLVQGEGAREMIAKGIRYFNSREDIDVLLIGRGGGSIEDLWPFNEELVAMAIAESSIPVVSAVGHETDFTIADFVSDLRAPTPSAGAEVIVPSYADIMERLDQRRFKLDQLIRRHLAGEKSKLELLTAKLEHMNPVKKYERQYQYIADLKDRLDVLVGLHIKRQRYKLDILSERLAGMSPYAKIKGGFAYVTDSEHKKIEGAANLSKGDALRLFFHDGEALAKVEHIDLEKGYSDGN